MHSEIALKVGRDGTTVHYLRKHPGSVVAIRPACVCGWIAPPDLDVPAADKDALRVAKNRCVEHHIDSVVGIH